MTRIVNDCTRCAACSDGKTGRYCGNAAWKDLYPVYGRPLWRYPNTPRWCPGMVHHDLHDHDTHHPELEQTP
jgi:hypothetical protein